MGNHFVLTMTSPYMYAYMHFAIFCGRAHCIGPTKLSFSKEENHKKGFAREITPNSIKLGTRTIAKVYPLI